MERLRSVIGALSAGAVNRGEPAAPRRPQPFITIARQAGAGGRTLMTRLVARLGEVDPAPPAWSGYDAELVEKVAADHHLYKPLVASLDQASYSWLEELFTGLIALGQDQTQLRAHRRVVRTIRALAEAGRVIIVGRGGVFITRDLPAGVHVRLVAPLDYRIEQTMQAHHLAQKDAAERVHQLDRAREAFYRRYWPRDAVRPEAFTVTFNTAQVSDAAMVESILQMIPGMPDKLAAHGRQHAAAVHGA